MGRRQPTVGVRAVHRGQVMKFLEKARQVEAALPEGERFAMLDAWAMREGTAGFEVGVIRGGLTTGYAVVQERYTPAKTLAIIRLAVAPAYQRRGCAIKMLAGITHDAKGLGFEFLTASVPDGNLPAQLLLRRAGWQCVQVVHQVNDRIRDLYLFERRL